MSRRRSSAPARLRHGRGAGAASRTEAAGAGRRRGRGWRGAFSASPPRSEAVSTLKLRPPPLSTPFSSFLFLPRAPGSPPCRLGRGNLQRAAKTQEEALTAAAAASNMADAVEPRTQSRRRQPARPLATRPREGGPRPRQTIETARARAAGVVAAGAGDPGPGLPSSRAAGASAAAGRRGLPVAGPADERYSAKNLPPPSKSRGRDRMEETTVSPWPLPVGMAPAVEAGSKCLGEL